jgi:hypothetical protein
MDGEARSGSSETEDRAAAAKVGSPLLVTMRLNMKEAANSGGLIRRFGVVLPSALGFALGVKTLLVALWALVQQAQPALSDPVGASSAHPQVGATLGIELLIGISIKNRPRRELHSRELVHTRIHLPIGDEQH